LSVNSDLRADEDFRAAQKTLDDKINSILKDLKL
jgi:hypothetical protein